MTCWTELHLLLSLHLRRFRAIPEPVRDELAQEALVRVWAAEGVVSPRALGRRVARNLAIDWLRRRRETVEVGREPGCDGWQRKVEARIDAERAMAALEHAPRAYGEVVGRCFLEEVDMDTLVEASRMPGEARHLVRDRIYKRRSRGLAWARHALETGVSPVAR